MIHPCMLDNTEIQRMVNNLITMIISYVFDKKKTGAGGGLHVHSDGRRGIIKMIHFLVNKAVLEMKI